MDIEVAELKANVNNLSQCLHALLRRIEQLEGTATSGTEPHRTTRYPTGTKTVNEAVDGLLATKAAKESLEKNPDSDVQVVRNETVTVDPETGVKKRTVVTERVVTTKTFHAIPIDGDRGDRDQSTTTTSTTVVRQAAEPTGTSVVRQTAEPTITRSMVRQAVEPTYTNGEMSTKVVTTTTTTTTTRIIQLNQNPFRDIDYDRVANLIIITRVKSDSAAAKDIHAGDAIVEVNGKPITEIKDLKELQGGVTLKMMPTPLHQGPSVYYRTMSDYDGSNDSRVPNNFSGLNLKKGDVIQAFSKDANWIQGRKVNDLSRVGLCPVSIVGEQVSMLTPYGRRVVVLLGVPGVGRRTLKTMLLAHMPQYFTTATPYTSRAPKSNELEGREYYFRTKEEMLKRIRAGDMIEWGELDNQLYGTSAETVRSCIRSGRVCVLDCAPQALRHLYNAEFMPFVVLIAPPEIDEYRQINKLRPRPYTEEQMKAYIQENKELMESNYAKMFHLVLVNRNLDVTFKRLVEALNELKDDVQWVPETWLRRE